MLNLDKPKLPQQFRHVPLQFASYKIPTQKQKDTTARMSLLQTRIDSFLLLLDDLCQGFFSDNELNLVLLLTTLDLLSLL